VTVPEGTSTIASHATTKAAGPPRCLVCDGAFGGSALRGLARCASCGFVTADTALDDDALAALYGRDYFHGEEYFNYVDERESLRHNFGRRLDEIERLAGNLRGKSALDIGCAYGYFVELATERGLRASGIDISSDAVKHARDVLGVPATAGDYLATPGGPYDLVTMFDAVEHLRSPHLFIAKIARELAPGGHVALTTGDIGSLNARMRGQRWRMIHPPTHLHYFSVPTLTRLLERNGLDVVHASHPGVSRKLHSIGHLVLARKLGWTGLDRAVQRWLPDLPVTLNLGDIMFIVARKTEPARAPRPSA
jgi:SAM-dependent methyltransferase